MIFTRRALIKALGSTGMALSPLCANSVSGQSIPIGDPVLAGGSDSNAATILGAPSHADQTLHIVNIESLEGEARKVIAPARMSFLEPAGDGWSYRENRRAFNDYPLMPHRLMGISEQAIDQRVILLGHELRLPIISCPIGSQGMGSR